MWGARQRKVRAGDGLVGLSQPDLLEMATDQTSSSSGQEGLVLLRL